MSDNDTEKNLIITPHEVESNRVSLQKHSEKLYSRLEELKSQKPQKPKSKH